MREEDLIQECLLSLSVIHNIHIFTLRKLFIKGVVKNWGTDPFTLGGFAVFKPYQVSNKQIKERKLQHANSSSPAVS